MNLTTCKKVCNECPFSINSIPGYLGPHSVEEIIEDMNIDLPFSCHLHRTENEKVNIKLLLKGDHPVCRGYILSASKSAKQFGQHPFYGKQMRELQKNLDPSEMDKVLTKWDFVKRHKEK